MDSPRSETPSFQALSQSQWFATDVQPQEPMLRAGIYYGDPPKSTYQARDLAEYEYVYSGLVKMSMEHPQIIGFGWCGYYESPHPGGRSGLMEVKDESPVPNLAPIVKKWNGKMADFVEKQNGIR